MSSSKCQQRLIQESSSLQRQVMHFVWMIPLFKIVECARFQFMQAKSPLDGFFLPKNDEEKDIIFPIGRSVNNLTSDLAI